MSFFQKKHLRVSVTKPKHPFTGGAKHSTVTKKATYRAAGAPSNKGATKVFCRWLFEIDSI